MSDLGLLMTDPMARACYDGRKTVTRRPMSPPPLARDVHGHLLQFKRTHEALEVWCSGGFMGAIEPRIPGAGTAKVGGRVWIRECWRPVMYSSSSCIEYRSGGRDLNVLDARERFPQLGRFATRFPGGLPGFHSEAWRPSIHMPKWAARAWGRIVSVRPERVQDITEADAMREGFNSVAAFRTTWDDCYARRGLGWAAGPWVWRIEWGRIERPGDL